MPVKAKKSVAVPNRPRKIGFKPLKIADAKGRVVLGPAIANQPVQVEESGVGEWTVRLVAAVPVKEAWLFKNPAALKRVHNGFQQAQHRAFAPDPRKGRDYPWLKDVDEENV